MSAFSRISKNLLVLFMLSALVACGGGGNPGPAGLDTDGDGIPNDVDSDDDNDGIDDTDDVDTDNDGLIEISNLQQLDWVRHDMLGRSRHDGTTSDTTGCPTEGGCIGYELTTHLDFDTNNDGLMDANDTYYDYDQDGNNNGWLPLGVINSSIIQTFTAIFEGNGYEIRNLFIDRPQDDDETGDNFRGLFGIIGGEGFSAEVRNLGLAGALMEITARDSVGALAGKVQDARITNCYAEGTINADDHVGGLIGELIRSSVIGSYSSTLINGQDGSVAGGYSSSHLGGLLGFAEDSVVTASYALGDVTGSSSLGGLIGDVSNSIITASYSTGAVEGSSLIGGFIGDINDSEVAASYSTGPVTGATFTGGFAGYIRYTLFDNAHWAVDSSGQNDAIGFDDGGSTLDVLGAQLSELKCPTQSNDTACVSGETLFSGWDAIDHDGLSQTPGINPWLFGTSTDLPQLDLGVVIPESRVLINEVDADTDGTDTLEFVELFDGGRGNTDLSDMTLVLYNGATTANYAAFDLDGFSTDENGYFVLGNAAVLNVGLVFDNNTLQNGADAVALMRGDAADFLAGTGLPTTNRIMDALVYDTNDADNSPLLFLLNAGQGQVNEASLGGPTDSNSRCQNGQGGARNSDSYLQTTPTPGEANDC